MPTNSPFEVPDGVTNDAELSVWYDRELENLGDEPTPGKVLELLRKADRSFRSIKSRSNSRVNRNDPTPYTGRLVSALMESGWILKRGSQKSKTLRPDAIRIFKRALQLIPKNPKACYRLGHLLKDQGRFGEAIGYFSRALELASDQADFQEDLKLNTAQIENAGGQAVALMQELISGCDFADKPTFDSEQVATLRNLLKQTWYDHVVYLTNVRGRIETNTISCWDYDDHIRDLRINTKALVVDRYNRIALIRYLDREKTYEYDTPGSGKLNYLLKALNLENWDPPDMQNTITQNIRRINADLGKIGADKLLEVAYSREDGGRLFCPKCDLTIHYFKSLLD